MTPRVTMYLTADKADKDSKVVMLAWDDNAPQTFEMRQGTAAMHSIPANTDNCPDDDICGM